MLPRGRVEGVWPLPPGLDPDEYVDIEYDAKGLAVRVEEKVEGCDAFLVRVPTYEKGRVAHSDYNDPSTGLKGRNIYEYDARGLMACRYELTPTGKQKFRIEVSCDEQGRYREERILDTVKRLLERHVYDYDAQGRLAKDSTYGKEGASLQGFHTLAYDDKGRIARRAWHDGAGKEVSVFTYGYDQYDRRVTMTTSHGGAVGVTSLTEYDDKGKVKSTHYVDAKGKPVELYLPAGTQVALPDANRLSVGPGARLADVAQVDPRGLTALSHVAYSHFESGRYEESRVLFESLSALAPDNPYFLAGVAAAALQQGQAQTALNWYDRALAQDGEHLPSLAGKGEALLALSRVQEALLAFQAVIKQGPRPGDPVVQRVRAILTTMTQPGKAGPPSPPKAAWTPAKPLPVKKN
jgi:tetratricopeptide (TPR) repeat protein